MRRLIELADREPTRRRTLLVWLLRLVAAGLVALVLVRLLGWEQGSLTSFAMVTLPVLLAAAYPVLLAAVLLRQRLLGVLALALSAGHVVLVMPSTGRDAEPCTGVRLRVVAANVLKTNAVPDQAGRVLLALRPDVLVLPELTRAVAPGLLDAGLRAALPHALADPDADFETTAIRSRLPLEDTELRLVSGQREPRASIVVAGVRVRLLGVHPQPPLLDQGPAWAAALRDLDGELADAPGAAVAAGDFNGSRDLASFRALLDDGVRDAHEQVGRGLAPTWPAGRVLPPVLHLDHVLVKDGRDADVQVCGVSEVEVPGSDHLAVVADLAVQRTDDG